jgi:hypothetical protein
MSNIRRVQTVRRDIWNVGVRLAGELTLDGALEKGNQQLVGHAHSAVLRPLKDGVKCLAEASS